MNQISPKRVEQNIVLRSRFRHWHIVPIFLAASLVFAATTPAAQAPTPSGNPPVKNTSAKSAKSTKPRRWFQLGIATWYGPHFEGKPTANGETFDSTKLTCAHRDLPLGSWLRVTNLHNHKTVIVRVNDRGPLLDDRIVDLSQQAADAIQLNGMAYVRLDLIQPTEISKAMITNISELQLPTVLPRTR